jgi:hypothetical protein
MAVAIQKPKTDRASRPSPAERHARARRKRQARSKGLLRLAFPFVIAGMFVYVGLYASVTATSYSQSRLNVLCRQERIKNERLKVELVRRSSPSNIMAAAQKAGMVYATDYEYLRRPSTVASARTGD